MREISEKLMLLCNEFQSEMYITLICVVLLVVGGGLMLGGEAREKIKKNVLWIVLGAIILGGAITLASEYGAKLRF